MRSLFVALLFSTACGTNPTPPPDDLPDAPGTMPPDGPPVPTGPSQFETCMMNGGAPSVAFHVGNFHQAVAITVVGAQSTSINSTVDKRVKQWTGQSYGANFVVDNPTVVTALAHDDALGIYGVDGDSLLHRWTTEDTSSDESIQINGGALIAVAVDGNASHGVVASATAIRIVDMVSAPFVSPAVPTELTAVTSVALSNIGLAIDGGAKDGHPMLETRVVNGLDTPINSWTDATITGSVRALAISHDGTLLVAVGDGFVATFDPTAPATPLKLTLVAGHLATGVALLSGKLQFVTVGSEGTLKVWDAATGGELKSTPMALSPGIAADRDGRHLYTSGADKEFYSWGCQ